MEKTHGHASVEFVLVLPIILFIFILVYHAARVSHVAQDLQNEVRTAAWQETLFGTTCGDIGARLRLSRAAYDHPLLVTCHDPESDTAGEFLHRTRTAGSMPAQHWNNYANVTQMTTVLDGTAPSSVVTRAQTLYFLRKFDAADIAKKLKNAVEELITNPSLDAIVNEILTGDAQQDVKLAVSMIKHMQTSYALDAKSAWLNNELPIGFDNYYWQRFPEHVVITDYFPCATGDVSSAERGDCKPPPPREYVADEEVADDPYEPLRKMCADNCERSAQTTADKKATAAAVAARQEFVEKFPDASEVQQQSIYNDKHREIYAKEFPKLLAACIEKNCQDIGPGQGAMS